MAPPMPSVACTVSAGSAVGMMCCARMRGVAAPRALAACTNSNSRADGSNRDSDGPRSAATMATRTMAAPTLLIANPRIDQAVQKIGDQVHGDVRHSDEQDASLHERIVAKADRLNQQAADARPREDRLGDDRASEHRAELQSNQCNHGNEAVSECVPD